LSDFAIDVGFESSAISSPNITIVIDFIDLNGHHLGFEALMGHGRIDDSRRRARLDDVLTGRSKLTTHRRSLLMAAPRARVPLEEKVRRWCLEDLDNVVIK